MVVLAATWHRDLPGIVVAIVAAFLAGAVLASVHHAEVIAHKVPGRATLLQGGVHLAVVAGFLFLAISP